jgi:hypothetical protein
MDWLEFISALIGHLAWPAVIIALLIVLRRHVGALADRLEEFSFGGAKFVWKKTLLAGAEIIDGADPAVASPKPAEPELPLGDPPVEFDETNGAKVVTRMITRRRFPRRVQALTWKKNAILRVLGGLEGVDKLIYDLADLYEIDPASPYGAIHSLILLDLIPESLGELYATLRDARNAIAHSNTIPNENEIEEFERQSSYLRAALTGLLAGTKAKHKHEKVPESQVE